jgi:hypothetical protein
VHFGLSESDAHPSGMLLFYAALHAVANAGIVAKCAEHSIGLRRGLRAMDRDAMPDASTASAGRCLSSTKHATTMKAANGCRRLRVAAQMAPGPGPDTTKQLMQRSPVVHSSKTSIHCSARQDPRQGAIDERQCTRACWRAVPHNDMVLSGYSCTQ